MYRTNDPAADFRAWDRDQSRMLERLPVCADCEEPIQYENYYTFDGLFYCPECVDNNHRKHTEEYIA